MKTASATAIGAAALRAVHQLIDGDPKILQDDIILNLLEPDMIRHIQHNPSVYQQWEPVKMRAHVLLRSRYTEDCLQAAVDRGLRQYMILGAGFDTFAYRQPAWAKALRIFEIDHPESQAQKRARLAQAGIAIPENLTFVPVNFETTSLTEGLQQTSFDFQSPAFTAWLGVLVYLSMDAIDATLHCMGALPASSELVLTFSHKKSAEWFAGIATKATDLGEPWLTHFTPEELIQKLEEHGFSRVSFISPGKAAAYFAGRTDGLEPPLRQSIAHAIV